MLLRIAIVLVLGSAAPYAAAQQSPSPLRFTLEGVTRQGRELVIDYGQIIAGQAYQTPVLVQNATNRSIFLDAFTAGRGVLAGWRDQSELSTRIRLRPGEEGTLLVVVVGQVEGLTPSIIIMEHWHELAHLDALYFATSQPLTQSFCFPPNAEDCFPGHDGRNWWESGFGGASNKKPYRACTLGPPPGMDISTAEPSLWQSPGDKSDYRSCIDGYAHCNSDKPNPGEGRCYLVDVQGHHEAGWFTGDSKDSSVQFRFRITVTYRPSRPTVLLKTRDELREELDWRRSRGQSRVRTR